MAYKKLKLWFDGDLAQLLADRITPVYPGAQMDYQTRAQEPTQSR